MKTNLNKWLYKKYGKVLTWPQINAIEKEARKNTENTYKEIYAILKKKIIKDYGTRCKYFNLNCPVCQTYLALDCIQYCSDIETGEYTKKH